MSITPANGLKVATMGASNSRNGWTAFFACAYILRYPQYVMHFQNIWKSSSRPDTFLETASSSNREGEKYVWALQPDYGVCQWAVGSDDTTWTNGWQPLIEDFFGDLGVSPGNLILVGCPLESNSTGSISENRQPILETVASTYGTQVTDLSFPELLAAWTANQTFTASAGTLTSNDHGRTNGMTVRLESSSTLPSPLVEFHDYYVVGATTNTFQLSESPGGSVINTTTAGSGTLRQSRNQSIVSKPQTDDIHIGPAAEIVVAYETLRQISFPTDVFEVVINGSAATLTSDTGCTASSVASNAQDGVNFSLLPDCLPWAIRESARAEAAELWPATAGWQQAIIKVTGLTSGTYNLLMNGAIVGAYSHTALNTGVNIADLTSGPIFDKCQAVLASHYAMLHVYDTDPATQKPNPTAGLAKVKGKCGVAYSAGKRRNDILIDTDVAAALAEMYAMDEDTNDLAQPATIAISIQRQGAAPAAVTVRQRGFRRAGAGGSAF